MKQSFDRNLANEAQKSGIDRCVVGAMITRDCDVLLVERPKEDFMGGFYEIPGGQVEEGETLDCALRREVKEETGLKVKKIKKYIGHFDYESEDGAKTRQFNFLVEVEEPLQIRLQEHISYVWVASGKLSKYRVSDSVREVLNAYWQGVSGGK